MKAALICGSPNRKNSASGLLLEDLRARLPTGVEASPLGLHTGLVPEEALPTLESADAWVFFCPLYVDGLPSHLLACLEQLEERGKRQPGTTVYAVVNCGFYEGIQAKPALDIFANWCVRAGLAWGGGIGVGGGGAITELPPMEKGPKAPVYRALTALGERAARRETGKDLFCSIAFPRFLYQMAAQLGWRKKIRAAGGRTKDLGLCPEETGRIP